MDYPPNAPSNHEWNFHGETVLISGGARGIGRNIVKRFANSGANVVFGDIDSISGRELEDSLASAKRSVRFVESDFSKANSWDALLDICSKRNWGPSIGIANAGIGARIPLHEISLEDYERVTAVNQRSALHMAQHLTPHFRKLGKGSFTFIGSIVSDFGLPNEALYGMSKSALLGLCRSLAIELSPHGIRANCIQPGFILLDVPVEIREKVPRHLWAKCSQEFRKDFENTLATCQPLETCGIPDDIAQAVCFLSSSAARFITGISLKVDGGYSIRFSPPNQPPLYSEAFLRKIEDWAHEHLQETDNQS